MSNLNVSSGRTVTEFAPSGDFGFLTVKIAVGCGRQANGDDVGPEFDRSLQFQDGQVVLEGALHVVSVDDDPFDVLLDGRVGLGTTCQVEFSQNDQQRTEEPETRNKFRQKSAVNVPLADV